jgi:hypothetical protein
MLEALADLIIHTPGDLDELQILQYDLVDLRSHKPGDLGEKKVHDWTALKEDLKKTHSGSEKKGTVVELSIGLCCRQLIFPC